MAELLASPGFPDEDRMKKGPTLCIECVEEIPCNPCETSCPVGAISVGRPITNLPLVDWDKCTACGVCLAVCPGLAIYLKDYTFEDGRGLITFPYEYFPLPERGVEVDLVDRFGKFVCTGEVIRVVTTKRADRTPLVSVAYRKSSFSEVVSMKRLAGPYSSV